MKQVTLLLAFLAVQLGSLAQLKADEGLNRLLKEQHDVLSYRDLVYQYYSEKKQKLLPGDTTGIRMLNRQYIFWNRALFNAERLIQPQNDTKTWNTYITEAVASAENKALQSPAAAQSAWSLIGPNYVFDGIGRVNRLAFHPNNANIIYAGTPHAGLWRSTTGGSSWTAISNFLPTMGISGIAVDPSNANTIYVLTGDGDAWLSQGLTFSFNYLSYSQGVMKTTDGGLNWTKTAPFDQNFESSQQVGFQLRQDPVNTNTLLAATSKGVYRTLNGGASWTLSSITTLDGTPVNPAYESYDIEFKPGNTSIVYMTGAWIDENLTSSIKKYSFFRSTDGGASFQQIQLVSPSFQNRITRVEIAVSPSTPGSVYLLCGPGYILDGNASGSSDTFQGFIKSTDNGLNFSIQTQAPDVLAYNPTFGLTISNQAFYDMALAVSPTNTNFIFTGGLVVFRSTDGGLSFSGNTSYWEDESGSKIHPDVHDLKYNPLDGKIYAATDGGVSVSTDNGGSWTKLFNGMSIAAFYHMEPDNENNKLWGGTQDAGIQENVNDTEFSNFYGGDGFDVMTDNIVGNGNDSYWTNNGSLVTTRITGNSDITPPVPTSGISRFFGVLDMDPANEDHILAGYVDALYYSADQGANWLTGGIPNTTGSGLSANWSVQTCPSNASRVYFAGGGTTAGNGSARGIWRTDGLDYTTQFSGTTTNLTTALINAGFPANNGSLLAARISDILVDPANSNRVWATASGFMDGAKVFRSTDAGASWTNISGTLPNIPINCMLMDNNGTIYLGTDIGVYLRESAGNDWIPYFNGLPRVPVTEMFFVNRINPDLSSTRYIYASTFGRSIWRSEPYTACVLNLNITGTQEGQLHKQASSGITSTANISSNAGTNVYFQAGNSVTLTDGFIAEAGTVFHSYIRDCNAGPIPDMPLYTEKLLAFRNDSIPLPALIEQVFTSSKGANARLNIQEDGIYAVELITLAQEKVKTMLPEKFCSKGKQLLPLDFSGIAPGFYHLCIYREGKPLNIQEVTIK